MTLDVPSILAWSLVGMLTGAIAAQFLTGRGYGMGGDIGIGILGALVAGRSPGIVRRSWSSAPSASRGSRRAPSPPRSTC